MLYSICSALSFCMDFGIAEIGIARGSPHGTTTEVLRVGYPFAEIRFVLVVPLLLLQSPLHSRLANADTLHAHMQGLQLLGFVN
jgi:hypothetical protein